MNAVEVSGLKGGMSSRPLERWSDREPLGSSGSVCHGLLAELVAWAEQGEVCPVPDDRFEMLMFSPAERDAVAFLIDYDCG